MIQLQNSLESEKEMHLQTVEACNRLRKDLKVNIAAVQALKDTLEKEQDLNFNEIQVYDDLREFENIKDINKQNNSNAENKQLSQQLLVTEQKNLQLRLTIKSLNVKLSTIERDIFCEKEDRAHDTERYELEILKRDNKIFILEKEMEKIRESTIVPKTNTNNNENDHHEGEKSLIFAGGLDSQGFAKFVSNTRQLEQRTTTLTLENDKLSRKLKAYKKRDEVNKQLRENWNKQLEQMEHAIIVGNEIYHREQARHEEELEQKDIEITKLRQFLLSLTNRQQQHIRNRQRNGHVHNSTTVIHGNQNLTLRTSSPRIDVNAPGARKSKIVVPKVIKAGSHRIKKYTSHSSSNDSEICNGKGRKEQQIQIEDESKKDF